MTALTQRVAVGGYYTDGHTLWEVVAVSPLGAVDLANATTGTPRTLGIDAFRRKLWLVANPGRCQLRAR